MSVPLALPSIWHSGPGVLVLRTGGVGDSSVSLSASCLCLSNYMSLCFCLPLSFLVFSCLLVIPPEARREKAVRVQSQQQSWLCISSDEFFRELWCTEMGLCARWVTGFSGPLESGLLGVCCPCSPPPSCRCRPMMWGSSCKH